MFNNIYRGKRVLVTGHTGFKGSWLTQWLCDLGAEVAGFSISVPTTPSHFAALGLEQQISHVQGDIREFDQVNRALKEFAPEIVFHLAAQAIVYESYEDPRTTFFTNLGGTVNVLDAIRKIPSVKSLVLITSDKCYENVEWENGYRETDHLGGKDPYSASKACAEIAASAYMRSFFSDEGSTYIATTRAGNVIGGGDWAAARIVPDCVRAWSEGKNPAIRNPQATRPWQHVLEPLSGYLWLGAQMLQKKPGLKGEAFNFGPVSDSNQTVEQVISEMSKVWKGTKWDFVKAADAKKEACLLSLNCDKARNRLGWKATLSFEETMRFTAKWYEAYYKENTAAKFLTTKQIGEYVELAKARGLVWAAH